MNPLPEQCIAHTDITGLLESNLFKKDSLECPLEFLTSVRGVVGLSNRRSLSNFGGENIITSPPPAIVALFFTSLNGRGSPLGAGESSKSMGPSGEHGLCLWRVGEKSKLEEI